MNEKCDLTFDHLGLAVSRVSRALDFVCCLGYSVGAEVFDPEQKVNLILCKHDNMPAIEIIYKVLENGPLTEILKHRSELMYHVCYRTKNLDKSLNQLQSSGVRFVCVSPPKPAILFEKNPVSFYLVSGFGLIEILEIS